MREADARVDPKERRKNQTQILEAVFEVYFRILKWWPGKEESTTLLDPTFTGLAQNSHLISVDFLGEAIRPGFETENNSKTKPRTEKTTK